MRANSHPPSPSAWVVATNRDIPANRRFLSGFSPRQVRQPCLTEAGIVAALRRTGDARRLARETHDLEQRPAAFDNRDIPESAAGNRPPVAAQDPRTILCACPHGCHPGDIVEATESAGFPGVFMCPDCGRAIAHIGGAA